MKRSLRAFLLVGFALAGSCHQAAADMTITETGNVQVGSAASPSNLTVFGTLSDKAGPIMPRGAIILWSGSASTVPAGWAICNGQNGTPDLRDRFIVGAGNTYAVNATGGRSSVQLTNNELPSHTHTLSAAGAHSHTVAINGPGDQNWSSGSGNTYWGSGSTNLSTDTQGSHTHAIGYAGNGQAFDIRPPYYAVYYLMKL